MLYRGICYIGEDDGYEGPTFVIKHFDSVRDAYEWVIPSLDSQKQDQWHICVLWSVIEDLKVCETTIKQVGYNDPQNPEKTPLTRLYIQKVDHTTSPLPLF